MVRGKKLIVVLPAFNAEKTLRRTYAEIPRDFVDAVILVDDASHDNTPVMARDLNIDVIVHRENRGYGGNQKTCYRVALEQGADIVVMVHPDYQYSPKLVTAMAFMIESGHYDMVLGSRIAGGGALKGGMPLYKYGANRFLTFIENLVFGVNLSEYHTGFRAFSHTMLENLPLANNSDDFVFDNEIIAQCVYFGYRIGEISCPARYFGDASSINITNSVRYGFGVLATVAKYILQKTGVRCFPLFSAQTGNSALPSGKD